MADDAYAVDSQERSAALGAIVVALMQRLQGLQSFGLLGIESPHQLFANHLHHEIGYAFTDFENNVADVTIGDDDVANAPIDVSSLDVADEGIFKRTLLEKIVGILGEVMPLSSSEPMFMSPIVGCGRFNICRA